MKYKNIVFIIPSFGDGGSQWVMIQLSNFLAKKKYNVDIITLNANGPYKSYINPRINIIDLSKNKIRYALLDIIKIIRYQKYETVISSQNYINFVTIILFKLFSRKTKIIIRESNTVSKFYKPESKLKFYFEIFFRKFYNFSNLIISPSLGVRDNLINKFNINKKKIRVLNNPTNIELINKLSKESINEEAIKIFSKPTIIAIGRLTYQKNFSFLIKYFSEINTKKLFNLVILGEGPLREELENQIFKLGQSKSIYLLGFENNPFKYIKKSRALVLTSLWEGMPNVIMHSLALNVPVISFDCDSGPREILENGKYGSLIKINDSKSLKYQLNDALNNNLKTTYPYSLFIKRYSIDTIGNKFSNFL